MRRVLLGVVVLAALGGSPADVRPQDDRSGYVNGAWLAAVAVSADAVSCGMFADIADRTEAQLRAITWEPPKSCPSPAAMARCARYEPFCLASASRNSFSPLSM